MKNTLLLHTICLNISDLKNAFLNYFMASSNIGTCEFQPWVEWPKDPWSLALPPVATRWLQNSLWWVWSRLLWTKDMQSEPPGKSIKCLLFTSSQSEFIFLFLLAIGTQAGRLLRAECPKLQAAGSQNLTVFLLSPTHIPRFRLYLLRLCRLLPLHSTSFTPTLLTLLFWLETLFIFCQFFH